MQKEGQAPDRRRRVKDQWHFRGNLGISRIGVKERKGGREKQNTSSIRRLDVPSASRLGHLLWSAPPKLRFAG